MPTPLSPETIVYGFTPAGDADVSPDGRRISYALGSVDRESKKPGSQVWALPAGSWYVLQSACCRARLSRA
jgi:hypothetical protein